MVLWGLLDGDGIRGKSGKRRRCCFGHSGAAATALRAACAVLIGDSRQCAKAQIQGPRMTDGPLKAGASGPEASPGPATATARHRYRPSIRDKVLRALLSSSSRTLRDYDDSRHFPNPLHPVVLRRFRGAGRDSGELGGAHAGIPPGDPAWAPMAEVGGGGMGREGKREGRGEGEEGEMKEKGGEKGKRERRTKREGDDNLCKDEIDLMASSRGR